MSFFFVFFFLDVLSFCFRHFPPRFFFLEGDLLVLCLV